MFNTQSSKLPSLLFPVNRLLMSLFDSTQKSLLFQRPSHLRYKQQVSLWRTGCLLGAEPCGSNPEQQLLRNCFSKDTWSNLTNVKYQIRIMKRANAQLKIFFSVIKIIENTCEEERKRATSVFFNLNPIFTCFCFKLTNDDSNFWNCSSIERHSCSVIPGSCTPSNYVHLQSSFLPPTGSDCSCMCLTALWKGSLDQIRHGPSC